MFQRFHKRVFTSGKSALGNLPKFFNYPISSYTSSTSTFSSASFFTSKRYFSLNSPILHKLPVVENLVAKVKKHNPNPVLQNTLVVYIHHALETSINVINSFIELGTNPSDIFVLGKHYSECPDVVQRAQSLGVNYQECSGQTGLGKFTQSHTTDIVSLWKNVEKQLAKNNKDIKNILILDHGGHALSFVPLSLFKYKIVGVEKTTGGIINLTKEVPPPFPVINMANCAAKVYLEPPLIASAVVDKLVSLIPIKETKDTCGVVGYGAIGKAIAEKLFNMGHKVIVYDIDPNKLKKVESHNSKIKTTHDLSALIASADIIFGCTGQDISKSLEHFRLSPRDKILISCSSEDKEFLSLLQIIQQKKNGKVARAPLNNVTYESDFQNTITILRGGFPVNFDNTGESVPAQDIQLTRALVLGAAVQAAKYFKDPQKYLKDPEISNSDGFYALDPHVQKFIVDEWIKSRPEDKMPPHNIIDSFKDIEWIVENSGGKLVHTNVFADDADTAPSFKPS